MFLSFSWAEDYYKLLGVERTADQRDIRKAFKKLAVTEHPDKKTVTTNFILIFIYCMCIYIYRKREIYLSLIK
jgi:hypothetical protein